MVGQKNKWGWTDVILAIIALVPVIAALLLYDRLPARMAVHFGLDGQPNGYQDKFSFIVIIGLLTLVLPLLIKVLQQIDPRRENYTKFRGAFEWIRFAVTIFLSGIFAVDIAYNLGVSLNFQMITLIGIGLLFIVIGNYLGQVRSNYFIGIRTPWTLAHEEVWRRTHRLAGPLWMIAGLVNIASAFMPEMWTLWVSGIMIGCVVSVPILYSYLAFRKLQG
jgi:uncharacterized membrane protein